MQLRFVESLALQSDKADGKAGCIKLEHDGRKRPWRIASIPVPGNLYETLTEKDVKINPLFDVWDFLVHGGPLAPIFWLLLLGSVVVAFFNMVRTPEQRLLAHLWNWFVRVSIGGLWWQQSLWKTPPTYGVS